ncbi:MAG: hypothetical protein GY827_09970 [Cytophagales bacterium]|nr:hypothetical protein [Cytophagales bacterium]
MNKELEELKYFVQHYFVNEIERLNKNEFGYFSFVLIAQAIEILGAVLDDKPFRAKNQSRKRFDLAIKALFDVRYQRLNYKGWLYENFRCNMSHLFMPSNAIILTTREEVEDGMVHLEKKDNTVVFIAEDFQYDLKKACKYLVKKIDKGQVKPKKLGIGLSNYVKKPS